MDNTMAALFFVRWFWRGQRDSMGRYRKSGSTPKAGQGWHEKRGSARAVR